MRTVLSRPLPTAGPHPSAGGARPPTRGAAPGDRAGRRGTGALARRLAIGLAAIAVVGLLPAQGLYWLALGNQSAIAAISAMGLTVLVGTAGLLSLGQAAFLAIGGFTAALLVTHMGFGFLGAMAAGGVVAGLAGALVAAATARTVGIYLAVGTLALQYVVEIVLSDVEVQLTSGMGFQMPVAQVLGIELTSEEDWWYFLCLLTFLAWFVLRAIVRGQPGRTWVCMKENATVAGSLGIPVRRARMAAFALSSLVAGAVGVVHGFYMGTVQITNYSLHLSIVYLTIAVLGRLGSIGGAIWAAAVITVLPQALNGLMRALGFDLIAFGAGLEDVVLGLILAMILLEAPRRLWARIRPGRPA